MAGHVHEMVLLSQIRQCFEKFTAANVTSFVEYLLDNGKRSTIFAAIYVQLYKEGDSNFAQFLESLLFESNKLIHDQSPKSTLNSQQHIPNGQFNCLPKSLMCKIGSYISSKEILTKWIVINRKFLEISYKAETHTSWDFGHVHTIRQPPKFSLCKLVSKVKMIAYNPFFAQLFKLPDAQSAESIELGTNMYCYECHSDNINESNIDNSLDQLLNHTCTAAKNNCNILHNAKTISLNHFAMYEDKKNDDDRVHDRINDFKRDVQKYTQLLDILLPLSPIEIEIKERLEKEITDDVRKSKTLKQIEKLENQIKQEIESHYNEFDENELTYDCSKNQNINDKSWHVSREMIALYFCVSPIPHEKVIQKLQLQSRLEPNRIQNSLSNLKCLQLHENTGIFRKIAVALMNSTCNQLTSLHIDDNTDPTPRSMYIDPFDNCKWKFLGTNPCIGTIAQNLSSNTLQQMQKQSWYPLNVQELCLGGCRVESEWCLWDKYINDKSFPNLKRLNVTKSLIRGDISSIFTDKSSNATSQISSLLSNGLELLHFKLMDFEYRDFNNDLHRDTSYDEWGGYLRPLIDPSPIIMFWKQVFDCCDINASTKNPLIFIVEFTVTWGAMQLRDEDIRFHLKSNSMKSAIKNVMNQFGLVFDSMSNNLKLKSAIRLVFRIKFEFNKKKSIAHELTTTIDDILEKDDKSQISDAKVYENDSGNDVKLQIVFQSNNEQKLNNLNFKYECCDCASKCSWIE